MLWPILVSSLGGNVLPPISHPAHSVFYVLVFLPSPSLEGYGNRIHPRLLLKMSAFASDNRESFSVMSVCEVFRVWTNMTVKRFPFVVYA